MVLPAWLPFHDLASLKSLSVPFRYYLIASALFLPVTLLWAPWREGIGRVMTYCMRWLGLLPLALFMVIGITIWGIRADVLLLVFGNAILLLSIAAAIDRFFEFLADRRLERRRLEILNQKI